MEKPKSSSNPYVYDQPVTGDRFMWRTEIAQIESTLSSQRSILLWGQHKIGKTSLLNNLLYRESTIDEIEVLPYVPFYLDLSSNDINRGTPLRFALQVIANTLSSKFEIPKTRFDDSGESFLREFLPAIYNQLSPSERKILFCFENLEVTNKKNRDLNQLLPFLQFLRRLILEETRLSFIFTSSLPPPYWGSAIQTVFQSIPLTSVHLSTFDQVSASLLITEIAANKIRYDTSTVEYIFALTNGHPYFTQLLSSKVFDAARASSTSDIPLATQSLVNSIVPDVLREAENVFEAMWRDMTSDEQQATATVAKQLPSEASAAGIAEILASLLSKTSAEEIRELLNRLVEKQILRETGGFLVPLFGLWIKERKPLQQTIEESKAQESAQQTEQRNEILVNFALNDRPTGEDKLGYDDYAKAFAQVLANPDTKTPLTIGIYGSWGMGKSFLMEKIKEQLKKVKGEVEEERKKNGLGVKEYHDFHFVHFNAWVYSGSENLWAGLVTKLYSEVERYFGSTQLNWHLMMEGLRSRWKKAIFIVATYGILAVLLSLLLDYNKVQQSWDAVLIAVNTLAGGSLVVALGSIIKALYDFSTKLIFVRSEQLAALSSRKDFRDKIGFMADIKTEIGRIGKMLNAGKEGRPVRFVIFIDDLDRCPPAKAVEVLEAIMLLLADDDGIPFIIFLGIDARVIVKAIEDRYGKVLVEAGITGYEYLDKIVQIPFRIPPANETALKNYVESLLWRSDKERKEAKDREKEIKEKKEKEEKEKEERAQEVKQEVAPKIESGEAGVAAAAISQTQTEGAGAVAASPDQKLPAQNDQVERESPKIPEVKIQSIEVPFKDEEQTAFKDFSRYYTPNPRRIKRIVNIYRIVRLLAGEQSAEFRRKMIKWVILSEQWPYRISWVLQKIEDEYQLSHDLGATLSLWSVFESVQERVAEGAGAFANLDGDKEVFEVFAKVEPLITVDDMKRLRAYTFNLNPALQSEVIKAAAVKPQEENLPKAMVMRA